MFKIETYVERRNALRKKMKSGLVLFFGNSESPLNYPSNGYHFRQDSNFLYFFGINHPDYVGAIDIEESTDCIYGNDYSIDDIIWMGAQPSLREKAAEVGVNTTMSLRDLARTIDEAIKNGRKIHFLPPYRAEHKLMLSDLLGIEPSKVSGYVSKELIKAVVSLREFKTGEELNELETAAEIGYKMHTTAMKMCFEGRTERDIAGAIEGIALSMGDGVSFHSIVSQNGQTLHNHDHSNRLTNGRLLLVDAGAETVMNYCSDNTRTIPVGGRFSDIQREVYNIVVAMINRSMELIKPDVTYKSVHIEACKVLFDGLKSLDLVHGNTDDAVAAGAHSLFMPHGLGHHMGIDVHDMESLGENFVGYDEEIERSTQFGLASLRMGRRLKKGHVITVEPGIYFIPALLDKWQREKIGSTYINYDKVREFSTFGGIRIEDDVLITDNGKKIIGKNRIPYTADEVENFMKNI